MTDTIIRNPQATHAQETDAPKSDGARIEPVRTCVGCRARAEKSSLLRVVVQNDVLRGGVAAQNPVLVADEVAVLPGRGAYVHPTQACFENAVKRRAFGRALHLDPHTPPDTANLQTKLNGIVKKAL